MQISVPLTWMILFILLPMNLADVFESRSSSISLVNCATFRTKKIPLPWFRPAGLQIHNSPSLNVCGRKERSKRGRREEGRKGGRREGREEGRKKGKNEERKERRKGRRNVQK